MKTKKEISEYECVNCGKQLWKKYYETNYYVLGEETLQFCSKKCGKIGIIKFLEFYEEEI
ncbi:MAG: hypothetical protein AABY22_09695 [Nanoarchaeota archaeon]